jgi:hypothetical protein
MEILLEILIQIGWFLLQVLGELIVQMIFELIVWMVGHGVVEPLRRSQPMHPVAAAIGYAILGAAAGGISLWLVPDLFIEKGWLRWLNVLLLPFAAGAIMSAIGAWRRHRDMGVIKLDNFSYGYGFALAMAVVRFIWGH